MSIIKNSKHRLANEGLATFCVLFLQRDVKSGKEHDKTVTMVDEKGVKWKIKYERGVSGQSPGKHQRWVRLTSNWGKFTKAWDVRKGKEGLRPKDLSLLNRSLSSLRLSSRARGPFAAEVGQLASNGYR
jgi:hypothetical protein